MKKEFKNKEDIQELGSLLGLALELLRAAHIKSTTIGKRNPLVLALERANSKVESVRSKFDDNIKDIMDDKTLNEFNCDLELDKVFYGVSIEKYKSVMEKYIYK